MVSNSEDTYRVTRHEWESEGARGGCIAVHFSTMEPFDMHFSIYDCSDHPQIKSLFFQMLDAWNQFQNEKKPAAEYACISCFYSILSWLFILQEKTPAKADDRISKAKEYIDRNYANSTLTITDIATIAGLGQRRFGELFHLQYKTTPWNYLTTKRINEAISLLKDDQYSIADIAFLTGYASVSYFIRIFRERIGTTPLLYRQKLK